jgi:citrate synthase
MGQLLDARGAAVLLGVDVRTLYAYVSRGSLRRVPGPDGRSSRYDSDDVELLARRSRPRSLPRPAASIDLVIATRVSTVTDGVVRYRDTDVLDLVAAGTPFEAVAELLWTRPPPAAVPAIGNTATGNTATGNADAGDRALAEVAAAAELPSWHVPADQAGLLHALLAGLGSDAPVAQRFAVAVASTPGPPGARFSASPAGRATADSPRGLDWPRWGRSLIATLIEASGPVPGAASCDDQPAALDSVARRLWRRWSPLRPTAPRVRALNTALVLLAEHELALSTLAIRVAASARAAPPGCLLAGLGVLSGTLHGDLSRIVQEGLFLSRAVVGRHASLPSGLGFGHSVHRHGDPRAAPLLRAVYAIATPADRDLIERAQRDAPAPPNVDFALGALCGVARMPSQATTGIFAVARTAGWIAHAAEEYAEPYLRFRGRAVVQPSPRTS